MMSISSFVRAAAGALCLAVALPAAAQWQAVTPGPLTVDGRQYTPSCSGAPGTDPRFTFWARKGSNAKNTVVFFEGGGACWDNLTCSAANAQGVPQFFVPMVLPGTNPALFDGVFRTDPANPVSDWNQVYIPYCTGDLHGGSATRVYNNVAHPLLPPGTPFAIQHRGFDNFMAVLDWMKKNQPKPKNLLVTGASAGGYGATLNFPWLSRAYPDAHVFVLADASQGVTTPGFDLGTPGRGSWNLQYAPEFGANPQALRGTELVSRVATNMPNAKVAQFTTAFDSVQVFFYCVMTGEYFATGGCQQSGPAWYGQMAGSVLNYAATVPNYRFYIAAGSYHTLMRSGEFYTESSAGVAFNTWLGQMLANRGGTEGGGGKWFSVACPGCLPQQ